MHSFANSIFVGSFTIVLPHMILRIGSSIILIFLKLPKNVLNKPVKPLTPLAVFTTSCSSQFATAFIRRSETR
jgi:hypothetical protein